MKWQPEYTDYLKHLVIGLAVALAAGGSTWLLIGLVSVAAFVGILAARIAGLIREWANEARPSSRAAQLLYKLHAVFGLSVVRSRWHWPDVLATTAGADLVALVLVYGVGA